MALGVAPMSAAEVVPSRDNDRAMPLDPSLLRAQRSAAERDVLACGLLLHRLLADEPALGVADTGQVIARLAPHGREFVRLPWTTPQPIPEALRAIVNRSTAGQLRLRYRNARTFLGAINGWRESLNDDDGGPLALLLDACARSATCRRCLGSGRGCNGVTAIESQRTDEIRGAPAAGSRPVVRAAAHHQHGPGAGHPDRRQRPGADPAPGVALIGVNGVRLRRTACATGPARSTTAAPRRCSRRSTGPASPATPRRPCARPATTERSCT
jgi:non-specific serine/threonine protein kinase